LLVAAINRATVHVACPLPPDYVVSGCFKG